MKRNNIRIVLAALVISLIAAVGCPHTKPPTVPGKPFDNKELNYLAHSRNEDGYWTSNGKVSLCQSCKAATELMRAEGTPEEVEQYRAAAKELVGNIVMGLADPHSGLIFLKNNYGELTAGHARALIFLIEALQSNIEFTPEEEKLTQGVIVHAIKYIETNQRLALYRYLSDARAGANCMYPNVSVAQIDALKAACKAGYKVDERVIEMADEFRRMESKKKYK